MNVATVKNELNRAIALLSVKLLLHLEKVFLHLCQRSDFFPAANHDTWNVLLEEQRGLSFSNIAPQ